MPLPLCTVPSVLSAVVIGATLALALWASSRNVPPERYYCPVSPRAPNRDQRGLHASVTGSWCSDRCCLAYGDHGDARRARPAPVGIVHRFDGGVGLLSAAESTARRFAGGPDPLGAIAPCDLATLNRRDFAGCGNPNHVPQQRFQWRSQCSDRHLHRPGSRMDGPRAASARRGRARHAGAGRPVRAVEDAQPPHHLHPADRPNGRVRGARRLFVPRPGIRRCDHRLRRSRHPRRTHLRQPRGRGARSARRSACGAAIVGYQDLRERPGRRVRLLARRRRSRRSRRARR